MVNIAVIGLGRISRTHIDSILHLPEDARFAAVVDVQESLAKAYSEEFSVPYFTSVDEALTSPEIDAVVLCLPHFLHAPITVKACNAGKHVLVEKIMANSYEEGKAMVESADKNGVNLMIGQSERWLKAVQEGHKLLPKLGKILTLQYNRGVNINSIKNPPKWYDSKEQNGGLIYALLGSHTVDFTLLMVQDRKPVSVYARGAANNPRFDGHTDTTILINFDDGSYATHILSENTTITWHDVYIVGTEGTMHYNFSDDWVGLLGSPGVNLHLNDELLMSGEQVPHAFVLQMKEFVDSIHEKRTPNVSGREILPQLKIIEAIQRSAEEHREIFL